MGYFLPAFANGPSISLQHLRTVSMRGRNAIRVHRYDRLRPMPLIVVLLILLLLFGGGGYYMGPGLGYYSGVGSASFF